MRSTSRSQTSRPERSLRVIVFALLLLFPTYSLSAELPKWKLVGELACYDFAGAKALKLFEVDAAESETLLRTQDDKLVLQQDVIDALRKANTTYSETITVYKAMRADDERVIKETAAALAEEQKWSLREDALPWAIGAAILLALGGGYAGYRLGKL
jgi:hypothetical protein